MVLFTALKGSLFNNYKNLKMKLFKYMLPALITFLFFSAAAQTPRINFVAPLLYPEGTAYYNGSFFVSSVTTGTVGKVDSRGNYSDFYVDPSLKSSYGMKVDTKRNKLWVCTGDANYSRYSEPSTYKKLIRLISLDLSTGRKIDDIDLSNLVAGEHFANDLTLDDAGNIYITDSYSPVIYKVDAGLSPSVFAKNDLFKSIEVGLNGIVWSPKGYLIVAHNTNGELYKVDVKQPANITKVKIKWFFPGADGLLFDAQGNLILVQNKGVNKVFQLASRNNWQSAEINGATLLVDRFDYPTTATLMGVKVYALNAKLNELTDPTEPPSKEFALQLARFVR